MEGVVGRCSVRMRAVITHSPHRFVVLIDVWPSEAFRKEPCYFFLEIEVYGAVAYHRGDNGLFRPSKLGRLFGLKTGRQCVSVCLTDNSIIAVCRDECCPVEELHALFDLSNVAQLEKCHMVGIVNTAQRQTIKVAIQANQVACSPESLLSFLLCSLVSFSLALAELGGLTLAKPL